MQRSGLHRTGKPLGRFQAKNGEPCPENNDGSLRSQESGRSQRWWSKLEIGSLGRRTGGEAKRNSRPTMLPRVGESRHFSCLKFGLDFASYLALARNFVALLRCCVVAFLRNCDVDVEFRGRGRHRRGLRRLDDSMTPEQRVFSGRRVNFFCSHLYLQEQ